MDIISRKTAKEKELKHYFTGKPCSEGGIGFRLVSNGRCYCDLSTKCSKTPFFRAGSRQVLQRLKHKNLIKKVIAFRLPNDIIAPLLHSGDTFYVY